MSTKLKTTYSNNLLLDYVIFNVRMFLKNNPNIKGGGLITQIFKNFTHVSIEKYLNALEKENKIDLDFIGLINESVDNFGVANINTILLSKIGAKFYSEEKLVKTLTSSSNIFNIISRYLVAIILNDILDLDKDDCLTFLMYNAVEFPNHVHSLDTTTLVSKFNEKVEELVEPLLNDKELINSKILQILLNTKTLNH